MIQPGAKDNAENAWMGWICPCGGKNLTMKARCTLCGQVKPLSAFNKSLGRAESTIGQQFFADGVPLKLVKGQKVVFRTAKG